MARHQRTRRTVCRRALVSKPGGSNRVGTSGTAANGNKAHKSHAGGYFAAEIKAPNSGGPAAAIMRWVVF